MKNKIDLEKIFNNEGNVKSPTSVAFKSEDINFDLESIKEALMVSDKIFLQMGYFYYDDESFDAPCFIFDGFCPVIEFFGGVNEDDTLQYLEYGYDEDMQYDEYYDRYKSEDAGYGIYLDKDLNVEYGYYTEEYSNGRFHKVFHDFENARDDDEVKIEISTILANADIWITADVSIDDFHNKCNLEKLVEWMNHHNASIFVAFGGNSAGLSNMDIDSIKEALDNHDKIFVEMGYGAYSIEDSYILFDTNDIIGGLEYGYYGRYQYDYIGYGIYLDKDLNVEYGYYGNDISGNDFNKTFYDFDDARDDDEVKNKIYSILDYIFDGAGIWNPYEVSNFPNDKMYCPNCGRRYNDDEILCRNCRTKLISGILVNERLQAEQEMRNNQIIELSETLDYPSVIILANRIILGIGRASDSKELMLLKMLKRYSFNEIIMMSKNIPKNEYMLFKSFYNLDDESARKFFEDTMDYCPHAESKELLLNHLLDSYSIEELYEKLMNYKSDL